MPHEPTVIVWTGINKLEPYSTLGLTEDSEQSFETLKVTRGVHRAGPDKIKHFIVDVEQLGRSENKDDYDVCGKVTVESKTPTEFNYGNIKGVLMMDTADYMSDRMKLALIRELENLIHKVKDLPTKPPKPEIAA